MYHKIYLPWEFFVYHTPLAVVVVVVDRELGDVVERIDGYSFLPPIVALFRCFGAEFIQLVNGVSY